MNEGYPNDWVKVVLMVSPKGEMHAIDGDRTGEDDAPYIGLERIKLRLQQGLEKPLDYD